MQRKTVDQLAVRLGGWEAIEARFRAWERSRGTPLVGLEAISRYTRTKPQELIRWVKEQKFPMRKDKSGEWVTTTKKISEWIVSRCPSETQRAMRRGGREMEKMLRGQI